MSPDKLVYMANQIGKFFAMRSAIFAHLDAGGAGLDPLVREAIEKLRPQPPEGVQAAINS